jgi:hypothetical protein
MLPTSMITGKGARKQKAESKRQEADPALLLGNVFISYDCPLLSAY